MLVFMDLASGYLLMEEVAVDRTYDTWYGCINEQEHSVILTLFADAVDGVQIPGQKYRYTSHSEAPTSDCC
jgi:hypothetical protein